MLEGLLPYLDADAQLRLLRTAGSLSADGSRMVIERAVALPRTLEVEARLRQAAELTGVPLADLLARTDPPDPAAVLTDLGWRASAHAVHETATRYGRVLGGPSGTGGFVTAALNSGPESAPSSP